MKIFFYCLAIVVVLIGLVNCDEKVERLLEVIRDTDEFASSLSGKLRKIIDLMESTTTTTSSTTTTTIETTTTTVTFKPTSTSHSILKIGDRIRNALKRAAHKRILRGLEANNGIKNRARHSLEFIDVDDDTMRNKRGEYDESDVNLDEDKENLVISNNDDLNNVVDNDALVANEAGDDSENVEYNNEDKVKRLDEAAADDDTEDDKKKENAIKMLSDSGVDDEMN
jgi:hypothetical protein